MPIEWKKFSEEKPKGWKLILLYKINEWKFPMAAYSAELGSEHGWDDNITHWAYLNLPEEKEGNKKIWFICPNSEFHFRNIESGFKCDCFTSYFIKEF